uniref:Uncharacterized protein n=1 Tax=Lactuca sativa TaxID=4236 RepID=A0A9R1WUP9_LACSA|nr:hypothetical protein LSAT_V11C900492670 [Lactuca sativa]
MGNYRASKSFDSSCIPNSCRILASSLCGLIVGECDNGDEYPEIYLFICKATTLDCKLLLFPISKYTTVKFAIVVMSCKPDLLKDEVIYDYFHLELFVSNTWEWRELRNT